MKCPMMPLSLLKGLIRPLRFFNGNYRALRTFTGPTIPLICLKGLITLSSVPMGLGWLLINIVRGLTRPYQLFTGPSNASIDV